MKKLQLLPKRRENDLLTEDLLDEIIVYDTIRHKAHCLSPIAAFVWRRCDGRTSEAEMVKALSQQNEIMPARALALVRLAFKTLGDAKLLMSQPPTQFSSRRDAIKDLARFGLAATAAMVTTIAAPAPAQAATCVPANCPARNNATAACVNNQCVYQCKGGFADCNFNITADGCETMISSDFNNCGFCGNRCASGQSCISGTCR
jgi:hypothetical protein